MDDRGVDAARRWPLVAAALLWLLAVALTAGAVVAAPAGAATWLLLAGGTLLLAGALGLGRAQQAAHRHLALQMQCLQEGIDALPLGVAIHDEQDRLVLCNRGAAAFVPYGDGASQQGQTYEALARSALAQGRIDEARGREEAWLAERLVERGRQPRPLLRSLPDGRWLHLYEVRTASGCLVAAQLDVSELVRKSMALEHSNQQLEQLSTTDALTGLANRRQFDRQLHNEWRRSVRSGQPLSLLLVDIDHFKRYNDHYGHLAGDACLRKVAAALFDCAQRSGELVARYGGEEFALLLPEADSSVARAVAQRCLEEVAGAGIAHADSPVSPLLTCSVGVATVVASWELVPDSLVRCADEALYRVKNSGRAQYSVAPCPA